MNNAAPAAGLSVYVAELHVHTVLSPCAEVEMIPPLIVQTALERGIQLLAITDHNACANLAAVQQAAAGTGLVVLPGLEIQTREEVHSLCLFDQLEQALELEALIRAHLPALENNIEYFGEQFVVDATGEFIRRETQLLLTSANLSLKELHQAVTRLGGLVIPAHVDRQAFGLLANLGLVPTDIPLAALEISRHLLPGEARQKYPSLKNLPLLQGGDAHRLTELLGANQFTLAAPTLPEIRLALQQAAGRALVVQPR